MSGRPSKVILCLLVSCGGPDTAPETGIDLTIAYDSTVGVDRLVVWGTTTQGTTRIDQRTLDAPYSLDPPGLRRAEVALELADALPEEAVVVRVDGRDAEGHVVGSGATTVPVAIERFSSATVTLGAPVVCGDGRTSTLEACDDGNQLAGDGCSDVCTLEVIGRCGDGARTGAEQCDDRNQIDGDGCSASCTLESTGRFIYEVERPEPASTTSPEFIDIPGATLDFMPESASDRWVVFASGAIGSSDPGELTAELRLLVNGIEVDRFGHQTLSTTDNEAGFVTFETITGATEEQVVTLQFRALLGTTRTANLRVVAALIPPGADFQYAKADELLETAGDDLELLRLDFTPGASGEYVVMAKGNLSEAPSPATARLWVQDDAGLVHPREGFSAPRPTMLPAFVAFTKTLDASPKSFSIRGSSSASGFLADWYSDAYPMRQNLIITAPSNGLPSGYPIAVRFDHATQVAAGRSLAGGDDVLVVARDRTGALVPIDRVVDDGSGWNRSDTLLWFATVGGVTPEYWIYWGGTEARLPPSNPEAVFSLYDTFDQGTLDLSRWSELTPGAQISNQQLLVGPQAALISSDARAFSVDTRWEAQISFAATGPVNGQLDVLTASQIDLNPLGSIGFIGVGEQLFAQAGQMQVALPLPNPLVPHRFAFTRWDGEVDFFIDDQWVATLAEPFLGTAPLQVRMSNGDPSVVMRFDWVRVRPSLGEEPLVELGEIEGRAGALPSRWSHRKLMAFRTDAFARAFSSRQLEPLNHKEAALLPLASLDVPAPAEEVDELFIAAARVSGEESISARKSGEVRANGELLLRTAHRIDRDSSPENGYHHVIGIADARLTRDAAQYELGIASPDGINVDGVGGSLLLLSYPARR